MKIGDYDVAEVLDSQSSSSKTTSDVIEIVVTHSGNKFTTNLNANGKYTDFSNDYYNCAAVTDINKMRQKEQLCDVTFKIGADTIKAHKLILALASPYFLELFNGNNGQLNQIKINILDSNPEAIKMLISYAYTGHIRITEDNCLPIFSACRLLQIAEVKKACTKFLMEHMTPANCLEIKTFAENQSCQYLYQHTCDYVLKHFPKVFNTEEFLQLPFEKVNELISNDQLATYSEEDVYNAVMLWTKHDLETRKPFFSRLIKGVRLPLLTKDFLLGVVDSETLFDENMESLKLILDATKYHLKNSKPPKSLQRLPKVMPYIFVTGGESSSGSLSRCEVFNPKTNTWILINSMQKERDRCGATNLERYIYVAGGSNSGNKLETVESYDPLNNTWYSQKAMNDKRTLFGICTVDKSIYVCGGYDGKSPLDLMERFDSVLNIWTTCPRMNTKRSGCKLAVIENIIYAVGGCNQKDLSVVEKFDPREGKWSPVSSMLRAREAPGLAVLQNELYCTGGRDSSCEKFNLRRNAWESIANMNSKRWGLEMVAVGDFLYAMGGISGSEYLNTVEQYDPKTDKWRIDISPMKTDRWLFGAAVLDCVNLEHILEHSKAD